MKRGFTLVELLVVVAIIGMVFGLFLHPYFEMRTFNKFNKSGEKATYLDAVFSELRIEAQEK